MQVGVVQLFVLLVVFGVGPEGKVGVLLVLIVVSVLVLLFCVDLLGVCWVHCLLGFLLGTMAVDFGCQLETW